MNRELDDTTPLSDERLLQLTDITRNGPEVVAMAKELIAWRAVLSVGIPSGRLNKG